MYREISIIQLLASIQVCIKIDTYLTTLSTLHNTQPVSKLIFDLIP